MDTTENYRALCNCKEIQEAWSPLPGDFCTFENLVHIVTNTSGARILTIKPASRNPFGVHREKCAWLPRIDQLIDLFYVSRIYAEHQRGFGLTYDPESGYLASVLGHSCRGTTAEQALLKEQMLLGYSKVWDGKQWKPWKQEDFLGKFRTPLDIYYNE